MFAGFIFLIMFGCCVILWILNIVVSKKRGHSPNETSSSTQVYTEQMNEQAKNNYFHQP